MKITSIRATDHVVPVRKPLRESPEQRGLVIVRLETDDGTVGWGVAGHYHRAAVCEIINRELGPALMGVDLMEFAAAWRKTMTHFNVRNYTGAFVWALSAIDIAVWDARGKSLGQPVWKLLGGASRTVPAYITFGLTEYSEQELVTVARDLVAQGHTRLKMVLGIGDHHDVDQDLRRLAVVREAVGPEIQLMADANEGYREHEARRFAHGAVDHDLVWLEEPLHTNDPRRLAALRRETGIRIAAGQYEGNIVKHRELLRIGAVDYLHTNALYIGGYTNAVRVAALAGAFDTPIANGGGWPHHNAHLQAGVENGGHVEFHYIMWQIGERLFKSTPKPAAGFVTLDDTPGLGLDPREDVLESTLVEVQ